MQEIRTFRDRFRELQCCVIIPTYNNEGTLEGVIRDVLNYTDDLIVVNDGCTDKTPEILAKFETIKVVNILQNTGKGLALQKGFDLAISNGYRYAITIDSDGQHFADDLPGFLDTIEKSPDSVVVGARNMGQDDVPGTSSFGHKFSIFWFRVETGQKIADVQSGFRLYPLTFLKEMRLFTRKYEFEVEVLVRLAWKGVKIISIPVKVYYAPKETRVTHFRKVHDFTRISIVNSILVFIALLWFRPFLFFSGLKKKSFKGFISEYILDSSDSNAKIAWSVAAGVFIGLTPFWGWQMMISFGVAHALKLNKFVTVAASNISLPPMLPFLLFLSYLTGGLILGLDTRVEYNGGITLAWVKHNLWQYIIGSFVFGIILAIVLGLVAYILLQYFRKNRNEQDRDPVTS